VLTFLTDHDAPRLRALDERIVRGWNARRPDAAVSLAVLGHEELRDKLERYLTDARPPDVMTWFANNRMRSLVERGLMLDVAGAWDLEGIAAAYDPRLRGSDGAHYLPTSRYWWAVYYRPETFAALGIGTPVETWDGLRAAAATLRAAGIAPFALGARDRCPAGAWFDYLDMRLNGPRFHADLMALRGSYLDERVGNVFAFWRELLEDGWFLGAPARYGEEEAVRAVRRGTAGMVLAGAYVTDEYDDGSDGDGSDGDDAGSLDFFRFPVIDPGLPVGEDVPVDGYFVAGNTVAPREAVAFLAHLGSREVQQLTTEATNTLPTRDDVDLTRAGPRVAKGMAIVRGADVLMRFYDLDTPWELADPGLDAFLSFLDEPACIGALLAELDVSRGKLRDQPTGGIA
jgi:multiple sugar transport system substrate-binding protein/raffinose/stachyose/melibiose transport system substrate-binding protein